MSVIVDLFYLPIVEFFSAIEGHEEVIVDDVSAYQKQTFRNRTWVKLANKTEVLSIPVIGGKRKQKYTEIAIDYQQKWENVHLRGIQSAYGKAPFYEFYFPYFQEVFERQLTSLWELNFALLTVCLKLLRMKKKITRLSEVEITEEMVDLRGYIDAKQDFQQRQGFDPYPYSQLFGVNFVPNLSIVDLLFCVGPDSVRILSLSKKNS
jgi:hypothetical protein